VLGTLTTVTHNGANELVITFPMKGSSPMKLPTANNEKGLFKLSLGFLTGFTS